LILERNDLISKSESKNNSKQTGISRTYLMIDLLKKTVPKNYNGIKEILV
jgi:hypothetical protein